MSGLPDSVATILYDADDTLFPSEEAAFSASATVVNELLAALGVPGDYSGQELRTFASGRNFRSLVPELLATSGHWIDEQSLERWVQRENAVVIDHLPRLLRPDRAVLDALAQLTERYGAALVSSSALPRLEACLAATGLDRVFPESLRFSAQDSLPRPTSKPDPAIYRHAVARLGIEPAQALAIEDAEAGVRAATGAAITTIGITAFVPTAEKAARRQTLLSAGAMAVVDTWGELSDMLAGQKDSVGAKGDNKMKRVQGQNHLEQGQPKGAL